MNNNSKISVIIPVYGVEDYIGKCIQSLIDQTYKNFEAIIIDDGSLDSSIEIAKSLVGNDPRFIFLTKENGGQASARNTGLDVAKGNYIAFVDPDDYLESSYFAVLYEEAIRTLADITCCGINYVNEKNDIINTSYTNSNKFTNENDFLITKGFVTNFMWDKLFKKSTIEPYRFDTSLRTNEDVHLVFRILFNKKITSVNKALYNYLQRPGSISKDVHPTYLQDRIAIKNKQFEFINEKNLTNEYYDYIVYAYLKTFVFYCTVNFARYSKNYSADIKKLNSEISTEFFTFKKIVPIIKDEPKVGLPLFLFKISPTIFRYFVKFWFRNAIA